MKKGYFGQFGGQYIPEIYLAPILELEKAFENIKEDQEFKDTYAYLLRDYVGRETPLYEATRLSEKVGGASIYLKREDLNHTGAHKINNAIGQALLAKKLGKKKIVAETGAGQHGVATATACALLDLECIVFMGSKDCERQQMNVKRMNLLGAKVVPVESGSKTLKDAVNEALRYWASNIEDTHYLIGSAIGPAPFPEMVAYFQSVIGRETRKQYVEKYNTLPNYVVACVGGGSNAIGMFKEFVPDLEVKLVGVEAAGKGTDTEEHGATLEKGTVGVLHGTKMLVLQNEDGQIQEAYSISAGLDYPGVGPEHCYLQEIDRVQYTSVTDDEAMEALQLLCRTEGIIPALESSHALAYAVKLAKKLPKHETIVVCLSGRGDKDMDTILAYEGAVKA